MSDDSQARCLKVRVRMCLNYDQRLGAREMALFVLMRALKLVVKVTCSQAHVSTFHRNFNLRLVGQTVVAFELWSSTSAHYLFDKASLPHDEFTTTKGVAVGNWSRMWRKVSNLSLFQPSLRAPLVPIESVRCLRLWRCC
ncbi:hypothetical protein F2Q68_00002813 [Brassica cretica]|uniref:Uncharacterized protein n=1 Tax=Brassica cretica TaxID=69181 RepID=A0A8S9JFH5_BRACR|nr:hypothetical protein F2Q68_00002813 [Brassica cretica]